MLKLFYSRRLASYIFLIFSSLLLLSTFFPQNSIFSTQSFIHSKVFFMLCGYLFLSLIICSIHRIIIFQKEWSVKEDVFYEKRTNLSEDILKKMIINFLELERWKVKVKGTDIYARKGVGEWASILFHLGMAWVMIEGLMVALFEFKGEIVVTEGQSVQLKREAFLQILRSPIFYPDIQNMEINFDRGIVSYEKGNYLTEFIAFLNVKKEGREIKEKIMVNNPLKIDGVKILLSKYGYAPVLKVKIYGKEVFYGAVNLLTLSPDVADSFLIPGTDILLDMFFYPEIIQKDPSNNEKSVSITAPGYHVKIYKNGRLMGEDFMKVGDVWSSENIEIYLIEIRKWVSLIVNVEKGNNMLLYSLIATFIALILVVITDEKKLKIKIENGNVRISGGRRFLNFIFKEKIKIKFDKILP